MRYRMSGVRRLIGIGLAGTAMVAAATLMSALPASATPVTGPAANGTYLALGDSVAFGYVPPQAVPAPNYLDPRSFVGYPEDVARALHTRVSNASCPGETTASFLVPGAPSNGCENSPGSSIGYRTEYPLHVQYPDTQMRYALKYLAVHRHTRLVTIDIGANDAFLCQETTADACASTAKFQAVLQEFQANLTTIYTLIRDVAHYHGLLVALTYYSISYSDPAGVASMGRSTRRSHRSPRSSAVRSPTASPPSKGRLRPWGVSLRGGTAYQASRRDLQHPPLACRAPIAGPGNRGRHIGGGGSGAGKSVSRDRHGPWSSG